MDFQTSPPEQKHFIDESTDEGQVRQLIEDVNEAVREQDVDRILSAYTPDAVIYDARDALEIDKRGLRKNWEECFQVTKDFTNEISEILIQSEDNLAFSHYLSHSTGTAKTGQKVDNWIRVTGCYSRIDGEWKIVHEHVSMPGDFRTGQILLDIKP